jgi:hypothetical protein
LHNPLAPKIILVPFKLTLRTDFQSIDYFIITNFIFAPLVVVIETIIIIFPLINFNFLVLKHKQIIYTKFLTIKELMLMLPL